jgi:hypothetical protein
LRIESKLCSRSQGQPPGPRNRAIIATDSANARAASGVADSTAGGISLGKAGAEIGSIPIL